MTEKRKLAAVMFTDITGYTALMSRDEQKGLELLQKNRDLQKSLAKKHNGEFLKEMGDGTLLCFQSALDAVRCAIEILKSVQDDPDLNLSIGIHLGDIVFREGDIFGDGVNVASRIEVLAEAGGICISEEVYRSVRNQPEIHFEFTGEKKLKNVDHPIKAYMIVESGVKQDSPRKRSDSDKKSIIVLPFDNMSPDPEQEYFSDGLTEEIITDLSHVHDLLVISRSSAMTFKGCKKKIREIALDVNVRYVLEGSVRKAGNNLRITAQLIDAHTDTHLWAEKYSGTLVDVFNIQEEVSRSIVDALKLELSPNENSKIAKYSIQNIQAYECFLKARYEIWRFTEDGLVRALHHLQNGLSLIGDNELLLAAKGMVYRQYINAGINPDKKYFQEIQDIIKSVFDLNSNFAHGYFLRGVYSYLERNFKEAVMDLKSAIDLEPNNPDALAEISRIFISAGKTDAARPLVYRLLEIDPLTPLNQCFPGYIDFAEGQFDKIVEPHYAMYKLDPENPFGRWAYAWSLFWNQRFNEAYEIVDILFNETPENIFAQIGLFWKLAFQGKRTDALKVMTKDILDRARGVEVIARMVFHGYAILEEKEKTIDWIEYAVNQGFINYRFLNEYDYFLENIRGEERFKKLMERVKIEWENFEV